MTTLRLGVCVALFAPLFACGSAAPVDPPAGSKGSSSPSGGSSAAPSETASSTTDSEGASNDPGAGISESPIDPSTFVGDICGDILVSLAHGFAEGSVGLRNAQGIHVVLNEETYRRVYTITIDGPSFQTDGKTFPNDYIFDVTLDNDIASMCYLNSASLRSAPAEGGTEVEVHENFSANAALPIETPKTDPCAPVLQHLSRAVTLSAVGTRSVSTTVASLSETVVRDYSVHVDGKNFDANGKTFPNDHDFSLTLDNASASMCLPLSVAYTE